MATYIPPYPVRRVTTRDTTSAPVIWPAGTTDPATADSIAGDLFLDTDKGTNGTLRCFNGTAWYDVAALSS